MDAKTQQDVHMEMLYRGNQGYRWLWLPILIHGSEEKCQWSLTKMKISRLPQTNGLHVRWSLQSHWEKVEKIWIRLIKPISVISFHIFTKKKSTQLLSQLHLSRLWEFCHARSALVTSHTYGNRGWTNIIENELVNISKILAIVLNNIYLVILSIQTCHVPCVMQVMHVAMDIN